MHKEKFENKVFLGIVEDNEDPKKTGRVKIRIINVFDDIPLEDLPWAKPHLDLNGNQFIIPEVGKLVSVVFNEGNPYKPEYTFAEHYNRNLEEKLSRLSTEDYKSMRALMFDQNTQIYSNNSEGLKVDYKSNNINIKSNSINLNLRNNFSKLCLGDEDSDQQSVLGSNFMDWIEKLIKILSTTPYLSSSGEPVIPHPNLLKVLTEYKRGEFLSDNVYITSNNKISTVSKTDRINIDEMGDDYNSNYYSVDSVESSTQSPVNTVDYSKSLEEFFSKNDQSGINANSDADLRMPLFESKDGEKMSEEIEKNINILRKQLKIIKEASGSKKIIIKSGYRSPSRNAGTKGAAKNSQHLFGKASDFSLEGITPKETADIINMLINKGIIIPGGIGTYKTWVHYDIRGNKATWNG